MSTEATATANSQAHPRVDELIAWYDNETHESRQIRQAMGIHGFQLIDTGGGCTAFELVAPEGVSCLVTVSCDASAPTLLEDECIVTACDEQGNAVCSTVYESTLALIRWMQKGEDLFDRTED